MARQLEWPWHAQARERAPDQPRPDVRPRVRRDAEEDLIQRWLRARRAGEAGRLAERLTERPPFGAWGQERSGRARRPRPCAKAGDLGRGLRELERFIAEVGADRIEAPRREGTTVTVPLRARDGERYLLRIEVERYLALPPRCSFVDEHGRSVPEAWPDDHPGGPFRPISFICTPPTAEFYHYHSERRYRYGEGSLQNTVATIFAALQGPGYGGRHRSTRRRRGRPRG